MATFILVFAVLLVTFQVIIYWFVFHKVGQEDTTKRGSSHHQEPVSVIICGRNEEANLTKNLPSVLEQDYPKFEVVVVDDGSTDRTTQVVEQFRLDHPHLRLIRLRNDHQEREMKGKKFALQKGIEAARYKRLLLTDADCYPLTTDWISSMAEKRHGHVKIVLGFSPYQKMRGLLNQLIRFEGFFVGLQYLSFAKIGLPYMGVGRNLCIDKQIIEENKPFRNHSHVASGDDDLVVQQLATGSNTAIELTRESHVVSSPEQTLNGWLKQKQRHITTSSHYTHFMKLMLASIGVAQIATYPLIILLFICTNHVIITCAFTFLLLFTKFTVFLQAMKQLHSCDLWKGILIYDFLLSAFYINLGFLQLYKGQKAHWK